MGVGIQTNAGYALQDSAYVNGIAGGNNASFANLTAHAGGGQAAATPIPPSAAIVNVGTVASVNDSIVLPFALAGTFKMVFNQSANSCNVYGQVANNRAVSPAAVDTINGVAGSTPYAIAGGVSVLFMCGANGAWAALKSA